MFKLINYVLEKIPETAKSGARIRTITTNSISAETITSEIGIKIHLFLL